MVVDGMYKSEETHENAIKVNRCQSTQRKAGSSRISTNDSCRVSDKRWQWWTDCTARREGRRRDSAGHFQRQRVAGLPRVKETISHIEKILRKLEDDTGKFIDDDPGPVASMGLRV